MSDDIRSDAVYRLTFNLPAKEQFFTENAKVIRIRIGDDGAISFKASDNEHASDSVRVVDRTRAEKPAGKEAGIGGKHSDTLMQAFLQMGARPTAPFFLLQGDKNGWFKIASHFDKDSASPAKTEAHVRLWMPRQNDTKITATTTPSDSLPTMTQMIEAVRDAFKVSNSERRSGRPSREMVNANDTVMAFRELADEVGVTGANKEILSLVSEANSLLTRILETPNTKPKKAEKTEKTGPIGGAPKLTANGKKLGRPTNAEREAKLAQTDVKAKAENPAGWPANMPSELTSWLEQNHVDETSDEHDEHENVHAKAATAISSAENKDDDEDTEYFTTGPNGELIYKYDPVSA